MIKKGDCFYKIHDKRKYHVVAVLDEKPEPQIVYKFYGLHKQWWHYEIQAVWSFENWLKDGIYYIKTKKEKEDETV